MLFLTRLLLFVSFAEMLRTEKELGSAPIYSKRRFSFREISTFRQLPVINPRLRVSFSCYKKNVGEKKKTPPPKKKKKETKKKRKNEAIFRENRRVINGFYLTSKIMENANDFRSASRQRDT